LSASERDLPATPAVAARASSRASEAYETLLRERPEVTISDIGMPDEDGYSLIRRIRALPKEQGSRIPAVALTAYAQISDRTRALIEGFNNT
jgi:CheY-like chemotaxis protein